MLQTSSLLGVAFAMLRGPLQHDGDRNGRLEARHHRGRQWAAALLVAAALGAGESRAITLGELESTGGWIDSLDGSVRFSGWSFAPGEDPSGPYALREVTPTQSGFVLEPIGCSAHPPDECVLEHFDGSYGPGDNDDLVISFTIEGLARDLMGVSLEGTSSLVGIGTEYFGEPIYPEGPTRATAELDIGFDTLLHHRSCAVPGCDGVEDFLESAQFAGQAAISAQLLARVETAQYFSEPDSFDGPLEWGTTAQFTALGVSASVIPEPTTALLLALGLLGLGWARRASLTGPFTGP